MDWQNRISKAATLIASTYGIPGLTHAMDLNGYYGGIPRLPFVPVGPAAQAEIAAAFDGLKGELISERRQESHARVFPSRLAGQQRI
jgi:4-hydroxy-2-oxoglutarate aldolase